MGGWGLGAGRWALVSGEAVFLAFAGRLDVVKRHRRMAGEEWKHERSVERRRIALD